MRYVIRTFLAMTLFAFCWVAVGYGIYQMLQVGTCASGGPYVSARQCPDGTEAIVFALIGGDPAALRRRRDLPRPRHAARLEPPPQNAGIVIWFWTGLFWSLAAGCFLGVWGPEANPGPGGETGGLIVGFMGLIMGAGGLLGARLGRRRKRPPIAATRQPDDGPAGADGEPLHRPPATRRTGWRRSTGCGSEGTLTDAEFETLKAKIIEEA